MGFQYGLAGLVLLVITAIALFPSSIAANRVHLEHSSRLSVPSGWTDEGRCDGSMRTTLTLALRQQNLEQLEKFFWEVSDPRTKMYGKYLDAGQVGEIVRPSEKTIGKVSAWLNENGVGDSLEWSANQEFVKVSLTVAQAESLLGGVEFHRFRATLSTGSESQPVRVKRLIRTLEPYTVPAELEDHLDFIGGTNHFPRIKSMRINKRDSTSTKRGDPSVTPSAIKQALNISSAVGQSSKNLQSVSQFLQQYYSPSDLQAFQQNFGVPVQPVAKEIGPNDASNPGVEANLDIQYIMGVANNVPTWFISTGGEHEGQEPFLEWMMFMLNLTSAPYVNSISYGDVESSISTSYTQRVGVEFQKFGAMGRTIIFASGDDGVGCNSAGTKFQPNWPASSPYVTAVGGVVLASASPLDIQSDSISSGGFSNYFPQPAYQTAAVSNYLKTSNLPPASFYGTTGRAIPDVSCFSEDVYIYYEGFETPVGGTSCAAPVVGAVFSLINDARLVQNKPVVGFLNTQLYIIAGRFSNAFYDVTSGSDNGNGDCSPGFSPAPGWDPITGLGVPNFAGLKTAFGV